MGQNVSAPWLMAMHPICDIGTGSYNGRMSLKYRYFMILFLLGLTWTLASCSSENPSQSVNLVETAEVNITEKSVTPRTQPTPTATIAAKPRPITTAKPGRKPVKLGEKPVPKPTLTNVASADNQVVLKALPTAKPEALKLIKTVEVTPDENLDIIGAFCRINYVPTADKFLVTFGGTSRDKGTQGYGYKWYTTEMEFTGEVGLFENRGTDTASVMIDSTYYFLTDGGKDIWALKKYDPITWTLLGETSMSRDPNKEPGNDFMLAHVNGMLDASGLYVADADYIADQKQTDPYKGQATNHRFFTDELEFLETRLLSDIPHINASSMVFVDGIYNMVTSTAFFGDLIVMRYDEDWNYIGSNVLAQWGNWPMGTVYDPESRLFFVSYISMENIVNKNGFRNIRLAVFDAEWNSITDIAVTQYEKASFTQSGRPSVILHGGLAYVSYDISTILPENREENPDWECSVSAYEIAQ